MQPKDKKRAQRMSREQQMKQRKLMESPANRFLNVRDKEGNLKYPVAEKIGRHYMFNPDPILTDMRLANGYLHELRWRLERAEYHLKEHKKDPESTFIESDAEGMRIVKKHYGGYIAEQQTVHLVLSRLRVHLAERLLVKCDNEILTFEKFNEFVVKVDKIVTDLGFELFPDKVTLIEPL